MRIRRSPVFLFAFLFILFILLSFGAQRSRGKASNSATNFTTSSTGMQYIGDPEQGETSLSTGQLRKDQPFSCLPKMHLFLIGEKKKRR